jgi:hypothetical protein
VRGVLPEAVFHTCAYACTCLQYIVLEVILYCVYLRYMSIVGWYPACRINVYTCVKKRRVVELAFEKQFKHFNNLTVLLVFL